MSRRPRVTGFTRMFILLLIAAPLAYIGASYYNGEDGIQSFKDLLGLGEKMEKPLETTSVDDIAPAPDNSKIKQLQDDLAYKDRRIEELEKKLADKEKEIKELKNQQNNN